MRWTGSLNRYRTEENSTVTDCVIDPYRRVAIGPIKTQNCRDTDRGGGREKAQRSGSLGSLWVMSMAKTDGSMTPSRAKQRVATGRIMEYVERGGGDLRG
jgi:hypothetical protein